MLVTIAVTIALALSGCSSVTTPSASRNNASTSKNIVGFGATLDVWKTHHVADKSGNFIPGCCYNLDPKLKSWGGNFRYTDVVVTNGIITEYSLNLPENTQLKDAQIAALAELPKDAKVSFFFSQKESATLEVKSAILKPILLNTNIPGTNGSVDFVFCSVSNDAAFGYNASNVNSIWVKLGLGLVAAKDASC